MTENGNSYVQSQECTLANVKEIYGFTIDQLYKHAIKFYKGFLFFKLKM